MVARKIMKFASDYERICERFLRAIMCNKLIINIISARKCLGFRTSRRNLVKKVRLRRVLVSASLQITYGFFDGLAAVVVG